MDAPPFEVRLAPEAEADLQGLTEFLIDVLSEIGTRPDDTLERLLDALDRGWATLRHTPHTCRRSAADPRLRELIIGFGRSGYLALFTIEQQVVEVLAVRHQRESDYR